MTTATTTEVWLYAGTRLSAKDKPLTAWHDGSKLLHFSKFHGVVGHAYTVETTRSEGAVTVHGTPRYLHESDRRPTDKQLDEWRAEDRAAKAIIDGKRVEKQAADDDELDAALEVIRRHYDRLRTMGKRGAFINYVTGEMTRPPRRKEHDADHD